MKVSVFFLAILLVASCATSRYSAEEIERFKKIENPLERWKAHNIHSYSYEYHSYGFMYSDRRKVEVRDNKMIYVYDMRNDSLLDVNTIDHRYTFDQIIEYYQNNKNEYLKIQYDSIFGYPALIYCDYGDEIVFDGECTKKYFNIKFLD